MDDVQTGHMPMAATLFRTNSRLDIGIYYPAPLYAQDGATEDLEAGLISSRQSGDNPMGSADRSRPGLLHRAPSTWNWTAQSDPLPVNTDDGVGSYGVSVHESDMIDGSLGITHVDSGWDIVNFEPNNLTLTSFSNGQITETFHGIPGTDIVTNGLGIASVGVVDECPAAISTFPGPLGSGNFGGSPGVVSFGDRLETISHESLGLENLDPGLEIATFAPDWVIPNSYDSPGAASLDDNSHRLYNLDWHSYSVISPPYPTLGAVINGPHWPGALQVPWLEEPSHIDGVRSFQGVPHASTGFGFPGVEPDRTVDSDQYDQSFCPNWLPQSTNRGLALIEQSGSAVERRAGNTADQRNNVSVRKRKRHTETEWEDMIDKHIRRLYCEKGYTIEECAFVMSAIHGFEAGSLGTYQKVVPKLRKDSRLRTAQKLPKPQLAERRAEIPFEIISEQVRRVKVEERLRERQKREEEIEIQRQLQAERGNRRAYKKKGRKTRREGPTYIIPGANIGPFHSTVYLHQEELFHAIDSLLKGLFAAGEKRWSVDCRHFKQPQGTPNSAEAWQHLSDQVSSIYMLVEMEQYQHASVMLGQVLAGLEAAARGCDPSFMVHFWTICHTLTTAPVGSRGWKASRGNPWLGWFLRHLKPIFSSALGKHPLVDIVDSLLHVWASSPRDLKATLGLGHWKAIHTLGGLVGNAHSIVLNMGVCCTKMWKSKFSASSITVDLLRQPLLAADAYDLGGAEWMAEVSLDYLFAASKEEYNSLDVVHEASQLLSWTGEICREKAYRCALEYDSVTRAFVFSSKLVATHHLETWKQPEQQKDKPRDCELSFKHMNDAIEVLRHGNLQCRILAASFSKRLSTWIKGNAEKVGNRPEKLAKEEERKKVLKAKARTKEILGHITEEPIQRGSRRKIAARGPRRNIWRDERIVARDLLLASLSA